jgi:alkyl hydroperoxide reductase subunit AhpC
MNAGRHHALQRRSSNAPEVFETTVPERDLLARLAQFFGNEVNSMLGIGQKFPEFALTGVVSNDIATAFQPFDQNSNQGKWKVIFFWPKDFTFVCPTEIAAFGKLNREFNDRDAVVYGVSIDSEFVHLAWRKDKEELRNLPFPMLSDIKRELSTKLGILDQEAGVAQRATYVVDPEGVIRFVYVTDLNVGRNPEEVIRVLDALQTDELCPCNWKKGEDTLKAA